MQYVCLVYAEEGAYASLPPAEQKQVDEASLAYDRELEARGKMVLAHALHSERKAKVVRRRARKAMITDGPFTEAKELLVGFIVVEAEDMSEAVELASDIPMAGLGTVVVRETLDFG